MCNNRCCECKFALYGKNGNPTCICGNNVNELNSRYFGCHNKPHNSAEVQIMTNMCEAMFDKFCEIVDEDESVCGVKVTRDLRKFGKLPELNGFFANWVFYNTENDENFLVMYTSVDGSEDIKFSVVTPPANYGALVSWETGIKMVINN